MKVSLYKRTGSRHWWLRWTDSEGNVHRVSSRTDDKEAAREIADEIEADLARWMLPDADEVTEQNEQEDAPQGGSLLRQIEDLEDLMLTVARYQAEAQDIIARRQAELMRRLVIRVSALEGSSRPEPDRQDCPDME